MRCAIPTLSANCAVASRSGLSPLRTTRLCTMIERNYSKDIASHVDDLVRPTLLDLSKPTSGNVVPLAGRS